MKDALKTLYFIEDQLGIYARNGEIGLARLEHAQYYGWLELRRPQFSFISELFPFPNHVREKVEAREPFAVTRFFDEERRHHYEPQEFMWRGKKILSPAYDVPYRQLRAELLFESGAEHLDFLTTTVHGIDFIDLLPQPGEYFADQKLPRGTRALTQEGNLMVIEKSYGIRYDCVPARTYRSAGKVYELPLGADPATVPLDHLRMKTTLIEAPRALRQLPRAA